MGVPCVAALHAALMANRVSRLRSGRNVSTSGRLTGCTLSTMYTWALLLPGAWRTPEMTIKAYNGSVARRAVRL